MDDGPLIPARPAQVKSLSQESLGNRNDGGLMNGSPRSASGAGKVGNGVPQRKPTGPRPITGSGTWTPQRQR
ncbi:MAG: hypothetical protein Q9223_003475 [Gallowayella weberi]